jgi:hypothetical protein
VLLEYKVASERLHDLLRTRTDEEAGQIFKWIRGGIDTATILRQVESGDLILQLALTPETRFRYVLPYKSEMPVWLKTEDNPYLDSLIYSWTAKDSSTALDLSSASESDASGYTSVYLMPYRAASIIEPMLDSVKPSDWTSVSSDNKMMRNLLAAYFQHQYHQWPIFHKDFFLEDMAAQKSRFCSSLLVNAVLANACVSIPSTM